MSVKSSLRGYFEMGGLTLECRLFGLASLIRLAILKVWSESFVIWVKHKGLSKMLLPFLMALTQSSCTNMVLVEGSLPTPLVEKIPARLGVYYSEEFKSYQYKENLPQFGAYEIDLGNQNLKFFRNLSGALFAEVLEIDSPELTSEQRSVLDAVFIPRIVEYGFLVPAMSTLSFHEVSIKYEIQLKDRYGKNLGRWSFVGYGKAEASRFGSGEAVGEATMLAIRDGGARIATEVAPAMATALKEAGIWQEKGLAK